MPGVSKDTLRRRKDPPRPTEPTVADGEAGTSRAAKHDPYAAFRVDSYRQYTIGWLIAALGKTVQGTAVGWDLYERTGSALALGMVGLITALPTLALALPAGYLADGFSRRAVMIVSLIGTLICAILLAVVSSRQGPIYVIYLLLMFDAVAMTLGRPARTALLPQILPREVFPNAVTWNSSLHQLTSVMGPALGGFVVSRSVPASYLISAAGSLIFLVLLCRMRIADEQPGVDRTKPLSAHTVIEGLLFIRRTPILLAIMSLDMFAVLLGGAVYLLPIFARDIMHVGANGFGWLRAAPAAGAFCMALWLAHRPPMRHAGRNLLLSVAGFGVATIVFGISTSFWLSLGMLFLTGAFDNVSVVIRHTLVQLLTPDAMRGRVTAVNFVFISASNELGGLESGLVAHWFNPVFSVVSGGVGTLMVVAATALGSPRLRRQGSLGGVRPEGDE